MHAESIRAPLGHVLLVDDDPAIRTSYAMVLRRRGYSYRVVESGQQAWELIARESFDAVLSDISMPGLDGLGLLKVVRAGGNPIPFIFMTGSPQTRHAIQALELGAARFLLKPMNIDELGSAVDETVQRSRDLRQSQVWIAEGQAAAQRAEQDSLAFDSALEGLWPAFQPIVETSKFRPVAFEALMRTTFAELASPLRMLEVAERRGTLRELGRTMRELVARAMRHAPADALFFVNLHPQDLEDDHLFCEDRPLTRFASRVVLEITERASLSRIDALADRIARLRELGFKLAVDDLGAGYAGLTSLTELRPEFVKLDAALVRGVDSDPVRQNLISSLTDFCHRTGSTVIAEGVETAEESAALVARGCDWLQGYYFARPMKLFSPPDSPDHGGTQGPSQLSSTSPRSRAQMKGGKAAAKKPAKR